MTTMTTDSHQVSSVPSRELGPDAALIYRIEGELRHAVAADLCPDGARFVNEIEGTVVIGPLSGGHLTGLERLTLRRDGTALLAGTEMIESEEGPVSLDVRAHVVAPADAAWPRPEVAAAPGFDLPDLDCRVAGSALVSTAAPRYAHLDGVVASIEGWVNFESGEMELEARAM